MKISAFVALCLILVSSSAVPIPVNYAAGQDPRFSERLYIVNGESALSESYKDVEYLQRSTEVITRVTALPSPNPPSGILEANIRSNVIGSAHIGWLSIDPSRHAEYGRSIEDLIGAFSIERFIQLWNNSTAGEISVDWMPCI